MNWIIENWYLIISFMALLGAIFYVSYKFFKLPTKQQIAAVKEWLVYACIQAEKELGSKTGQVKLRFVYDMFVSKFTYISKLVSFEYFSALVDEALETVRKLLETNTAISNYVGGEKHGNTEM